METHVSLFLSRFTLAFGDLKNSFIEIIINNKRENIPYPQTNPLYLVFPPKFVKDKQLITINAKKKLGNKFKIIAHGELVLYKNNFIEGKGIVEKTITMVQIESRVDTIKINKENMGKIFVTVSLVDSYEDWVKKIHNRGGLSSGIKYRRTIENKPFNFTTYRKINFDDEISLLTVTKIDRENENYKNIDFNLDEFMNINEIKKVKNLFENNYQNNLPHDFTNLKKLNQNLYSHYQQLDNIYKTILENIQKQNNDIRIKAKETWDKYKEGKKQLYKNRIEYKLKKQKLSKEINLTKDKKIPLEKSLEEINTYKNTIYNQILGQEDENNKKIQEEKNDIKIMSDLVNKLYSLGYNIEDEMNGQEKKILNDILNNNKDNINIIGEKENIQNGIIKNEEKEKKEEIKEVINDEEKNKENYNDIDDNGNKVVEDEKLSEQIVALIERDVNDLYSRKLIEKMKIDQINTITYKFSTEKKEMNVSFKIQNNNLICSNGQTFAVWLISNFNS